MRRSCRSVSKEDIVSVLIDSGISLSSSSTVHSEDERHHDEHNCFNSGKDDSFFLISKQINVKNKQLIKKSKKGNEKNFSKTIKIDQQKEVSNISDDHKKAFTSSERQRKIHKCYVCNKVFGGKTDLKRHVLIHSNERPYTCKQCEKSYRQAVNLKNHITTAHENKKSFQCDQCSQRFALKERLRLHKRLHSGEKPYSCKLCEKRFPRGGQLQQHMTSYHKDCTKQVECTECTAKFSTVSNLRAHMVHHEEGNDHRCEICNERFLNQVWLNAHVKKVHSKMRAFDCNICKETIDDEDFVRHIKRHSHFKTHFCEECKVLFTQKSQYNVHMRMHSGERPYQCRICWLTFAHSSVLKLHIRKHTGEKPFDCVLCNDEVAFSQLAHLKTHMRKIHNQENSYVCSGCQFFFKTKNYLLNHVQDCELYQQRVGSEELINNGNDLNKLSNLRFLIAIMLKKISSEDKLQQLGFEKRLIDNVVIASLKLANRKAHDDNKISVIERLRLNIAEFLDWIVPTAILKKFYEDNLSVDSILEKIVAIYMKEK